MKLYLSLMVVFLFSAVVGHQSAQDLPNQLPAKVLDVKYSPDSKYLAQVSSDGQVEVISALTSDLIWEYKPTLQNHLIAARLDWSPTENLLAVGIGSQVFIWDSMSTQLRETLSAGGTEALVYFESGDYFPEGITSLQWSSDGALLLAQSLSSRYTVWSLAERRFIVDLNYGNNPIPVVWLPDNRRISHGLSALDIYSDTRFDSHGQRIGWTSGTCGGLAALSSNSDRTLLVGGTANGCVIFFDSSTGDQIAAYKIADENDSIVDVSWSPDSRKIVTISDTGDVQVLVVESGDTVLLRPGNGSFLAVDWAFSGAAIVFSGYTLDDEPLLVTVDISEVDALLAGGAARRPEIATTPNPR